MTNQDRLNLLKEKFSPTSALTGVLETLTPMLQPVMERMERPKSEGGMLDEGQHKISIMVILANGKVKANIVPLKHNKETQKIELCTPVQSQSIEDMIKQK